jgi:hypothetical protein
VNTGLTSERVVGLDGLGEAIFDDLGIYRYRLSRVWDDAAPRICWIMLNPSTATAGIDDRTICRVIAFSRRWSFGSATVVNLFALRTRRPGSLAQVDDPVGAANDGMILESGRSTPCVIAAWGNHGSIVNPATGIPRCEEVRGLLTSAGVELTCLAVTDRGQPGHPLYLRKSVAPRPFR